jgi:RNA polymerase sigma factor (sigma-70 family)
LENRQRQLLELLDTSGATLYALLTRLTLRDDVAEELMQDLFIKLSNTRRLGKIHNWGAYAHRAAINLAFDWRRRQKRALQSLGHIGEPVSGDGSPLGELIHAEELQETLNAIAQLRKVPRQALVMRYIQQESYECIAEQLGKTPHQVRALCSKALDNLRRILGKNGSPSCGKELYDV